MSMIWGFIIIYVNIQFAWSLKIDFQHVVCLWTFDVLKVKQTKPKNKLTDSTSDTRRTSCLLQVYFIFQSCI